MKHTQTCCTFRRSSTSGLISLFLVVVATVASHGAAAAGAALPRISVAAMDASASETGADNATFFITREGGSNDVPLAVSFKLSGTATQGADYADPGVVATFFRRRRSRS